MPETDSKLESQIRIRMMEYKDQTSIAKVKTSFHRFVECEKIYLADALKSCQQKSVQVSEELKACANEDAKLINRPQMMDLRLAENYFSACAGNKSSGMKVTEKNVQNQLKLNAEKAKRLQDLFAN